MRKQQAIWKKEHAQGKTLPSIANPEPSQSVLFFLEFLKQKHISTPVTCIDIGCGKGSNTVYLATLGNNVYAMDYIQQAIDVTKKLAKENKVSDSVHTITAAIDELWPFPDNFFDIAFDCFSSIDIETKSGREIYRDELLRTLKPDGYALITVVSNEDEIENQLIKTSPGKEIHSAIWPSGKFQKDYSEKELREFYKEFNIILLEEITKHKFKLGKKYLAKNFWLILQKKI